MKYTLYAIFRNAIETLACTFVFTVNLPRRKYFWLRAVLSSIVFLGIYSAINYSLGSLLKYSNSEVFNLLFWLLKWLLCYVFAFLTVLVCFDVSPLNALFFAIASKTAQEIMGKISYVIEAQTFDLIPLAATIVIYILVIAAVLVICYFVFIRNFKGGNFDFIRKREIFLLSIGIISGTISGIWIENFWEDSVSVGMQIVVNLQTVIINIFILSILFGLFRTNSKNDEIQTVENILEQERKQYEFSKETMDLINVKCHDMKHMLGEFEDKIGAEELKELQSKITIYGNSVKTGNKTLDVVISEKSLRCENHGITLSGMAEGAELNFMTEGDVYSLFGNMFDNAIEACCKIENPEERFISYSVKKKGEMLFIRVENSFNGDIEIKDGMPVTKKEDKNNHGFGIKSINMVVKKYDGDCVADVQDNLFRITATIKSRETQKPAKVEE